MDVVYQHCAGLDVHKKTIVACCLLSVPHGRLQREVRTFGTTTRDLLVLADWLITNGVTHVAMESTGEYWKPVYNLLEALVTVLVVNARHIKNVPGRKTDVKDAEWIADLLRHGLLRGSFIPPEPQRDLRDLTRQRTTLVQERAAVINRLQKVLEWANLKLAGVATDIVGVSARAMLEAIIAGEQDATTLADLAHGRMRSKRAQLERALEGRVREHHRFLIAQHLIHIDFLDEQIGVFDTEIAAQIRTATPGDDAPGPPEQSTPTDGTGAPAQPTPQVPDPPIAQGVPWDEAVELLDTLPGVGPRLAEILVAEIGTDMRRFPSPRHLASWAKVAPGNYESAGKRTSGKIGKGNRWLRSALVQAAHAAVRVKESYLAAVYRRLVSRRGVKKAIVAVAHKILRAVYIMLVRREPYRDLGASYLDSRRADRLIHGMQRRFEQLGYRVHLEPLTSTGIA